MSNPYPGTAMPGGYTDIRSDSWIDRWAPARVRPYLKLARLDRPIGTWLLLFPCWWSIALASVSHGALWPDLTLMLLFCIGALVMRGAGCTVNDLWDRHYDAAVERTRSRPIPSGQVSVKAALAFLVLQLLAGLMVLLQLNVLCILLGILSLALVFTYPLAKRVTWWPQVVLGLTFNWGALMGWVAVTGTLDWPPVILYCASLFWTVGYDTIYAHQDKEDDAKIGVKSSALRLGAASRPWVLGFYAVAAVGMLWAGLQAGLGWVFVVGMAAMFAQMVWQVWTWRLNDQADCLVKFKSNRYVGWLLLTAVIGDGLARGLLSGV